MGRPAEVTEKVKGKKKGNTKSEKAYTADEASKIIEMSGLEAAQPFTDNELAHIQTGTLFGRRAIRLADALIEKADAREEQKANSRRRLRDTQKASLTHFDELQERIDALEARIAALEG